MTAYQNPFTHDYFRAAARQSLELLAPGITPDAKDESMLELLAVALGQQHNPFAGLLTFRRRDEDGQTVVTITQELKSDCFAECWIEDSSRPTAFFYWES